MSRGVVVHALNCKRLHLVYSPRVQSSAILPRAMLAERAAICHTTAGEACSGMSFVEGKTSPFVHWPCCRIEFRMIHVGLPAMQRCAAGHLSARLASMYVLFVSPRGHRRPIRPVSDVFHVRLPSPERGSGPPALQKPPPPTRGRPLPDDRSRVCQTTTTRTWHPGRLHVDGHARHAARLTSPPSLSHCLPTRTLPWPLDEVSTAPEGCSSDGVRTLLHVLERLELCVLHCRLRGVSLLPALLPPGGMQCQRGCCCKRRRGYVPLFPSDPGRIVT